MKDLWKKLGQELEGSWSALGKAFGPARDENEKQLVLAWLKNGVDVADRLAVGPALEQGCREVWATTERLNAVDVEAKAAKDGLTREPKSHELQSVRLRPKKAEEMCELSIHAVCSAGMFEAAMDAFDKVCPAGRHAWDGSNVLARLVCDAVKGPRQGWPDPLDKKGRLERLVRSPWWTAPRSEEWGLAGRRSWWGEAIQALGRASAMNTELSASCGRLTSMSVPLWSENVGSVEHFGCELARGLGHMKIARGELDLAFWRELPFEARLGMALGSHGESKLGAWCCARVIEDGVALNRLPEVAAGIWCGFERERIGLLERTVGSGGMDHLSEAMDNRLSGSEAIMAWHYLDEAWEDKRAKWARSVCASLGIKKPDRVEGAAQQWTQLALSLHAMRQALSIKKELAAAKKERAQTSGSQGKKAIEAKKARL